MQLNTWLCIASYMLTSCKNNEYILRCNLLELKSRHKGTVAYVAKGDVGACPRRSWKLAFVSGFWGLRRQTHAGALSLDPAGDFRPPVHSFVPPPPVANSWLRPCKGGRKNF